MTRNADSNIDSVRNVFALLNEITSSEGADKFEFVRLEDLSSQNSLASMRFEAAGILGMSLNTFKKLCNLHVAGGFTKMEAVRKMAFETLQSLRVGQQRNNTKAALRAKIFAANNSLSMSRQDLDHLTGALRLAIDTLVDYARDYPVLGARLQDDLRSIRAKAAPVLTIVQKMTPKSNE